MGTIRQKLPLWSFTLAVSLALAAGWHQREEYWYTAERGPGYLFGITGLTLMALLLLYPLRKHWRPMRNAMPVRYWFRMHMVFGVLGPLFILYHANFSHGSINSTVALYSMLLVAGSGLIGRYVYVQIHRGIYGEAIRYRDLVGQFEAEPGSVAIVRDPQVQRLKARLDADRPGMWTAIVAWFGLLHARRRMRDDASKQATGMLLRMARLRFYSRLFSWWHVFHLPIFFLMLVTAAVHVVVVHMY